MQTKRVVITGLGVVSPVGTGVEKFWQALIKGQSGIRTVSHFDAADFDSRVNGDVIDYDPLIIFVYLQVCFLCINYYLAFNVCHRNRSRVLG